MGAHRDYRSRTTTADAEDGLRTLAHWYAVPGIAPFDAVRNVQISLHLRRAQPGTVLLAALANMGRARDEIDLAELQIIDAARAAGMRWRQIGEVLGFETPKQGAIGRYKRLRRNHPEYQSPLEAPDEREDDEEDDGQDDGGQDDQAA